MYETSMAVERVTMNDEDLRPGYLVTVTNRSKKLLVSIPIVDSYGLWSITYDDGSPVSGLDGKFTSHKFALKAIDDWQKKTPISEKAKHELLFGDKEPPVLKTKKVKQVATETEPDNSSDVQ